jgi:hypothetical protein
VSNDCTHTILILYSHCTPTVLILHSYTIQVRPPMLPLRRGLPRWPLVRKWPPMLLLRGRRRLR